MNDKVITLHRKYKSLSKEEIRIFTFLEIISPCLAISFEVPNRKCNHILTANNLIKWSYDIFSEKFNMSIENIE